MTEPRATVEQTSLLDALADTPTPATDDPEWQAFVRALRRVQAGHDGMVSANHVRPEIRGLVHPNRIGSFYGRARKSGLIRRSGFDTNNDTESRNVGKPQHLYVWSGGDRDE